MSISGTNLPSDSPGLGAAGLLSADSAGAGAEVDGDDGLASAGRGASTGRVAFFGVGLNMAQPANNKGKPRMSRGRSNLFSMTGDGD